jgi:hypothetical protein
MGEAWRRGRGDRRPTLRWTGCLIRWRAVRRTGDLDTPAAQLWCGFGRDQRGGGRGWRRDGAEGRGTEQGVGSGACTSKVPGGHAGCIAHCLRGAPHHNRSTGLSKHERCRSDRAHLLNGPGRRTVGHAPARLVAT